MFFQYIGRKIIAFAADEQVSLIAQMPGKSMLRKYSCWNSLESLYRVKWTLHSSCFTTLREHEVLFWSLRNSPTDLILLIVTAVGNQLRKLLNSTDIAPIQESMKTGA